MQRRSSAAKAQERFIPTAQDTPQARERTERSRRNSATRGAAARGFTDQERASQKNLAECKKRYSACHSAIAREGVWRTEWARRNSVCHRATAPVRDNFQLIYFISYLNYNGVIIRWAYLFKVMTIALEDYINTSRVLF